MSTTMQCAHCHEPDAERVWTTTCDFCGESMRVQRSGMIQEKTVSATLALDSNAWDVPLKFDLCLKCLQKLDPGLERVKRIVAEDRCLGVIEFLEQVEHPKA